VQLPKEGGKPQQHLLASPLREWVTEAEQVYSGVAAAEKEVP